MLDRKLSSLEAGTSAAAYSVESRLGDIEDLLSYSNDLLCTGMFDMTLRPAVQAGKHASKCLLVAAGVAGLSQLFLDCLWDNFVRPILIAPIQQLAHPTGINGMAF